ncbi:hypothetical protein GJAV_G00173490 [Gymnothorax javanicus]|nr:hypothetical protein GJAV_G00173490 [Gymnothorax javanicus]
MSFKSISSLVHFSLEEHRLEPDPLPAQRRSGQSRAMPFIISMLLASLNSCCNPWIYLFFAGHLFHDLKQHFLCCSRRYLKSSQCNCERESSRKSNSSTFAIKSTSSQKSITQTSVT